jgi:hypothetical protein
LNSGLDIIHHLDTLADPVKGMKALAKEPKQLEPGSGDEQVHVVQSTLMDGKADADVV